MGQAASCWLHTTETLVQYHDRRFGIWDKKNDTGAEFLNTIRGYNTKELSAIPIKCCVLPVMYLTHEMWNTSENGHAVNI